MVKNAIFLSCFISLVSLSLLTVAQNKKRNSFKGMLDETGVVYTHPTDYTFFDDTTSMIVFKKVKNNSKNTSAISCTLQNDHEDINISITLLPYSWFLATESYKHRVLLHPNEDVNHTFSNYITLEADEAKSKVYYYNQEELKKVNASKGAIFSLDMNVVYLNKYTDCKVVILQRDNIGLVLLYYFYNNKTKNKIDEEINQTFGFMKFKRN